MKILVDSISGDGLALALRLQDEGHEVAIAIEKSDAQRAGEGLVDHVDDPVAHARDEDVDLVLVDMVGHGGTADALRDLGIPIFGGGRALDLLELDRIHGLRTFKALGLTIPETEIFEDANFDRAIEHVKQDQGKWVFKPCGNLATDKTFIGEDVEEMVDFIEHERERAKGEDAKHPAFVLQRFVEGIEVSCERVYAQGHPVVALDNMTFEEKKFLAGNLGPAVGCAGNLVLAASPRLVHETVAHLDRWAMGHAVSSMIDLNTMVTSKGVYILEATARFGYDALWSFLQLWDMPIGETFSVLAEGIIPPVVLAPLMAAAVRVSVPPYPSGDASKARGTPIVDAILDDDMIWPVDVMQTDEGDIVVAGTEATAYVVTGLGRTPEAAYRECYNWLKDARLPDRMYRVDLAERVSEQLPQLVRMGYTTNQHHARAALR